MVSFLGIDFYFQLNLVISVSIDVVENRLLIIQVGPVIDQVQGIE